MSDFNSCDFGVITPDLVLQSLLSGITGRPACGLRVKDIDTDGVTMYSTQPCATVSDLFALIQRSLVIADDDNVAIRCTTTTSLEGAGLSTCGDCDSNYQWWEYVGSLFCQDVSGVVYLNIIKITT